MFEKLNRMLLAPEDGGAGSSGAGASAGGGDVPAGSSPASTPSPAPSSGPAPRVPFVNPDDGAPAPRSGTPGQGAQPGASAGGPPAGAGGGQDNPIPYTRVQQMLAKQREQILREVQASMPRGPSSTDRLALVKKALEFAGIQVPDEQPQYVTREQMEQVFSERISQIEREAAVTREFERGSWELEIAKAQHAEVFQSFPQLEETAIAIYANSHGKSMSEIVKGLVDGLEGYYGARNKAYAAGKRTAQGVVPVRPTSSPGGAPQRPQIDLSTSDGMDAAVDELFGAEGS